MYFQATDLEERLAKTWNRDALNPTSAKESVHFPADGPQSGASRDAVQKLHRNKSVAMRVVNLVDGANVGMVEGRRGLGFALEPGESVRIFRNIVRQRTSK